MNHSMKPLLRWLGSLKIAVPLLIAIAAVLAWGTIYEARFGTASVQRVVYHAWWFQAILGFLAVNLAVAAAQRYPWKKQHTPFVLAHIGIILILLGGIIGGRFGISGQMTIAEGQGEKMLQLPTNVLVVHHHASDLTRRFPTDFDTHAWVHQPNQAFLVPIGNETLQLTVDTYYPDAQVTEEVTGDGVDEAPAVQVHLSHEMQEETLWLLANDPERFGVGWGGAHVIFLAPETPASFEQLTTGTIAQEPPRGVVSIHLPREAKARRIPVPDELGHPIKLEGTPYTVTFKDYFPDFTMTEQGLGSRSEQPNNPAVSFTLSGPEGADAHLLFALHPDFPSMHARAVVITATVGYTHVTSAVLPPNAIALIRSPSKSTLTAALTGMDASTRQLITPLETATRYEHPSLGYAFEVLAYHPKARLTQHVTNRSDEVKAEALHVTAQLGDAHDEAWAGLRGSTELHLGKETIVLDYQPDERELPVTIKLSDFRKTEYPGISMAEEFESDVQLTDTQRGLILMRKISMNNPLRYRGYSFFQSSYIPGQVETTILSVRNDPGTPIVYAGFLIVIAGLVSLFVSRSKATSPIRAKRRMRSENKGVVR